MTRTGHFTSSKFERFLEPIYFISSFRHNSGSVTRHMTVELDVYGLFLNFATEIPTLQKAFLGDLASTCKVPLALNVRCIELNIFFFL
jgi:hypothetical protein